MWTNSPTSNVYFPINNSSLVLQNFVRLVFFFLCLNSNQYANLYYFRNFIKKLKLYVKVHTRLCYYKFLLVSEFLLVAIKAILCPFCDGTKGTITFYSERALLGWWIDRRTVGRYLKKNSICGWKFNHHL